MLLHPTRAMLKLPYDSFYSSVAAAYSTRRMFTAYTGPLVRIRRSSDNTEQDIYSASGGAIDATSFTTFVGASTAYVTTWYDQSGHGKHLVQATQSKQPSMTLTGLGGRPTLTMTRAAAQTMTVSGLTANSAHVIYAVGRLDADNGAYGMLVAYGGATDKTSGFGCSSATPGAWWAGGLNLTTGAVGAIDYVPHVFYKQVTAPTGGLTTLFVDGSATLNNLSYNYSPLATGALTIGGYTPTAGPINGSISELMFFTTTSVNRLELCAIGNRWIGAYDPLRFKFTAVSNYHVFMIAGQSNALGMGAGIDYTVETADPTILQWANGGNNYHTAMVARDPLWGPDLSSQNLGGLGTPGVGFATAFARQYKQAQGLDANTGILLVNCAYGGYGYSNTKWQPTAAHYLASVAVMNDALANGPGTTRTFKGILWHQGEVDVTASYLSTTYQTRILETIDGLRSGSITGASGTIPFVVGQMVPEWYVGQANGPAIHAIHAAIPSLRTYTGYWAGASNGYNSNTYPGGNIHYSAAGQRLNGIAAYNAYIAALANH